MCPDPSAEEPPDDELIGRASAGDVASLEALFRRHARVIFRFARLMTGSSDAADDITQDVFVVLMKDLPRYDARRSDFRTYLFGITRNLSRRRWRRERWYQHFDFWSADDRATDENPLRRLEGAHLAAQVRRALRSLPIRYREVILLCDVHDLTYADASVVVGASIGAVRARLHRGRHLLRERLKRSLDTVSTRSENSSTRCAV